ncbi:MFS transporter [Yersinia enterocolitica]|uniref:MFS transporter n=1 Tax=Yersinia enterocolitica TaxID=630 RepID=UPI00358DC775
MVFLPDSILTTIQLGVSVPSAGLLVSIYALGVAIGAPLLTALTGRIPRKVLLIGLMVLFTLGNLLAWQSPGYESLVVVRLLTGLAHGVFFSIGSTIATSLVPKEKAASAIAIMFGGLTVALVTGVPLGTFIGQHFGWRETFLAVSLIGVVAIIASAILVPNNIPNKASASIKQQLQVLTHPRLLLIYGIRIWRFLYHVYFPGPRYARVGRVLGCCGKLDFAGIRNICCDW